MNPRTPYLYPVNHNNRMQKEIVSTKLPIIPHFPPCDTKMRPCHRHCRKRNEENIPDDATRGSDTENAPASSLSTTAIRTASPRPSRYRWYAVRKIDTAEQVLRRIRFKFRPGRPHNDRHGHPVARHQISPFSFFSRTARSISSVMDFISHFGFQPHSSRAQVSSRLSGQLRAMDSLTGSTS